MPERPVSPHFTVYRWAYTMTLSILHRATGLALSLALIGLVLWLVAIGLGPAHYAAWVPWLTSWPAMLVFGLAIVALVYHFCNGLRHLAWDVGWGFERHAARRSAWVVIVATVVGSVVCLYFLLRHGSSP
jgi:succinate dehydrogenase / fumarate reductase, cytochrome b subunit